MKLTEKQKLVYDELISMSSNGVVLSNDKSKIQSKVDLNSVSFGLVFKALSDKGIISIDKNGGNISIIGSVSLNLPKKIIQDVIKSKPDDDVIEYVEKPIKKVNDSELFQYQPEDFNQNMFFELTKCGANFVPSSYKFTSKNSITISKMKEIIEFYGATSDALSKSQRTLRDTIINKHNLDMECKKIGNKMYFLNTWGIADLKSVVKDIINIGRKNVVISDNKVIVEIENNN